MTKRNRATDEAPAALLVERRQLLDTVELFSERLAELELALEDVNWVRLSAEGEREFSNEGLARIITLARLGWLKNPLIHRAIEVQVAYVFGQGVSLGASPPEVGEVVQSFLDDEKNQVELTSHQAQTGKERTLGTDANLFFVLFANPSTGRIRIRSIPVSEILAGDIITNPEDAKEPWLYLRSWTQRVFDVATGRTEFAPNRAYYPDVRYRPSSKPADIGGVPVRWAEPIYQVKVGGLDGMRFGVPELYSAIDWARAVKEDLERYATLRAALSRWAATLTTKGGKAGVAAAKAKLGSTLGTGGTGEPETNPAPVTGSVFIGAEGNKLEPFRWGTAVPSPDDGRRLGLMVSAGTGIPETILFGDAEVGNLATAKTLDRPTELKMLDRQTLWADVFKDLLGIVVERAAEAPSGPLRGVVTVERGDDGQVVRMTAGRDEQGEDVIVTFDVDFPAILERDAKDRVDAIVSAATLDGQTPADTMDRRTRVRLLLGALGVDDIDELVDLIAPEGPTPAPGDAPLPDAGEGERPAEEEFADALREVRAAIRDMIVVDGDPG